MFIFSRFITQNMKYFKAFCLCFNLDDYDNAKGALTKY